jgi:hypothetical protein
MDFVQSVFIKPKQLTYIEQLDEKCGNSSAQEQIILMGIFYHFKHSLMECATDKGHSQL